MNRLIIFSKITMAILLLSLLTIGSISTVIAEETVNLGTLIEDKVNWKSHRPMEFKDGTITMTKGDQSITVYEGKKFLNETLEMQFTASLEEKAWPAIVIRGSNVLQPVWSAGNAYMVVFKKENIEVQRWVEHTEKRLATIPNDGIFHSNQTYHLQISAVTSGRTVTFSLLLDGKEIFSIDDDFGPKEAGNLGFYAFNKDIVIEGVEDNKPAAMETAAVSIETPVSKGSDDSVMPYVGLAAFFILLGAIIYFLIKRKRRT